MASSAVGVYALLMRPWQLTWGATPEEVAAPLPGDDLKPHPMFNATRAIAIAAASDHVWPWLIKAGFTRIRSRMRPSPRSIASYAVVEIADIWMIRKMLLNVRERAERIPDVDGSTS
jgi:hypothetical protein